MGGGKRVSQNMTEGPARTKDAGQIQKKVKLGRTRGVARERLKSAKVLRTARRATSTCSKRDGTVMTLGDERGKRGRTHLVEGTGLEIFRGSPIGTTPKAVGQSAHETAAASMAEVGGSKKSATEKQWKTQTERSP